MKISMHLQNDCRDILTAIMEKITHIICFAVKLIMALLIVGGMVFIITVNSVCRTAFATFTSALAYGLLMCSFFFFLLLSQSGSDL